MQDPHQAEYGSRSMSGSARWLIPLIAGLWSFFQLAIADILLIDSLIIRCIHLAFASSLVFLSFPFTKKTQTLGWIDLSLALIAALSALYLAIDFEGISGRQGLPIMRDVAVGFLLLLLLLEGARRALGPVLPAIATLFMLSTLFASWLPEPLTSRDVSFERLVGVLTLSSEGVYGIPLRVSADTVFLFVLFGAMLERAGGGQYFVDIAESMLGRFRGGPAKAAVLASGLTGMVSGSSIANTVTTGTFTIPLMKKNGYPAYKAAAIEVAASTNGQLMPPIMGAAAFIIAEYCNMPYLEVVRAALLPAVLSYVTLFLIVHLEAVKLGLKGAPKDSIPPFWATLFSGVHFLIPLGVLVHQLVVERRSPSLSAYYAIGVLAVVVLISHTVTGFRLGHKVRDSILSALRLLWESLVAGGRNMMGIGVAVGAAGIIVGVVTLGLGGKVTEIIGVLSNGNFHLMLLITAVVSLILGMGLPTTANYIVMANLTAPAIIVLADQAEYAVPLIAAHLFCFYFGILADDTPPVGLAAYAAAAIARSDPIKTGLQGFLYDIRTAILPFVFIVNTDFLLIGVDSVSGGIFIFLQGLTGMALVAIAIQGHLHQKLNWPARVALSVVGLLVLRPDLVFFI